MAWSNLQNGANLMQFRASNNFSGLNANFSKLSG